MILAFYKEDHPIDDAYILSYFAIYLLTYFSKKWPNRVS